VFVCVVGRPSVAVILILNVVQVRQDALIYILSDLKLAERQMPSMKVS